MALKIMPFGKFIGGYFFYNGELYFGKKHGRWIIHSSVVDGIILLEMSKVKIYPCSNIKIVPEEEFDKYGLPAKWEKDVA
ncbi:MAG: hypothetical protein KAR54_01735 [Candidatus Pacebacteria bacterium]|nr:hypothetical protein [Candidatus Paceibacterota bacterium]